MYNFYDSLSEVDFVESCRGLFYTDFKKHCESTIQRLEELLKENALSYHSRQASVIALKTFVSSLYSIVCSSGRIGMLELTPSQTAIAL